MKKNFMFWVSSFGFRVIGFPRLSMLILVVFILAGFCYQVSAQDRRYYFKEGDVLEYEIVETSGNEDEESDLISKYRFTVNKVENDRYHITMESLSWSMLDNFIAISGQTTQLKPELRSPHSAIWTELGQVNAEFNNPIYFVLDSSGKIYNIQGFEKIQEDILEAASKSVSYKKRHNFSTVSTFYGLQKYRYLISEFFPALPTNYNDTVRFESEGILALRINKWKPVESPTRDELYLSREYKFICSDPDSRGCGPEDYADNMFITWVDGYGEGNGHPKEISYKGYINSYFTRMGFTSESSPEDNLGQVRVTNTYQANHLSKTVSIGGLISNLKTNKLRLSLPGNSISKKTVEIKPKQDGSIHLEFEMDCIAGLVDVYTDVDKEPIFKLFVQPGDSIYLTCDIDKIEEIQFNGSSSLEQYLLNSIKVTSVLYQDIDPFYLRYMAVEDKYEEYASQIWAYTRRPGKQEIPIETVIKDLSKYLRFTEGYLHDSYKNFVRGIVWAADRYIHSGFGLFDMAELYLIDWDLYWYKAHWTERFIKGDPDNPSHYHSFADLYPGTPFQKELEKLYKETEKWQRGQTLPKFKFIDLDGNQYKNRKFKDQFWGIITVNGTYQQALGMIKRAIKFNEFYEKEMKFLVWWPNQGVLDTLQSVINDENVFLLAGPENNVELARYLKDFPKDYLIIDPEERVITYDIDELDNLISWPVVKNEEERTIKLKTFWISFAGSFILTVFIVIIIRIRAKRKETRLNLKRKIAKLEVDAVRARMNPHFLFNALGSIQNMVNSGKNQEASLYLARFGDLVRTILLQSSKPVVGLNEEIDMIRNYLQLEQLGLPFTFDIQLDPVLDPSAIEIPPLLIQPHVENAVIHGVSKLGDTGRIEVIFRLEGEHLICEVKDNGPGYKKGPKPENEGLGQGWNLTRQRIQLMQEQYGEEGSVEVTKWDQEEDKSVQNIGTTVTFRLPMQKSSI